MNCTTESNLDSLILKLAVDVFYILGGFLSVFGITLNLFCYTVVHYSIIYNTTSYGLYLKFICITDALKLIAEYQLRIIIIILNSIVNSSTKYAYLSNTDKILHCNLRLGFIMITENLSYIYCILLAADRCSRIWIPLWSKKYLTLDTTKKITTVITILVIAYCHPHFYPIKSCKYIIYPKGYLTKQAYSDCDVLSSKYEYFSFKFYWYSIDSVVNSVVLPLVLVFFNILLSIGIFIKCKRKTCAFKRRSVNSIVRLRKKAQMIRSNKEASLIVIADTILFVIVITPVNALTYFYKAHDSDSLNLKTALCLIGLTISLINHSFNGVIYIICSRTFRIEFRRQLKKIFSIKSDKHFTTFNTITNNSVNENEHFTMMKKSNIFSRSTSSFRSTKAKYGNKSIDPFSINEIKLLEEKNENENENENNNNNNNK